MVNVGSMVCRLTFTDVDGTHPSQHHQLSPPMSLTHLGLAPHCTAVVPSRPKMGLDTLFLTAPLHNNMLVKPQSPFAFF